jgi:hypothetical protein
MDERGFLAERFEEIARGKIVGIELFADPDRLGQIDMTVVEPRGLGPAASP